MAVVVVRLDLPAAAGERENMEREGASGSQLLGAGDGGDDVCALGGCQVFDEVAKGLGESLGERKGLFVHQVEVFESLEVLREPIIPVPV